MKFLKNNISIISTLILVVLLSQARVFDFLIETYLGRLTLITIVSLIAYFNKIIGLVAVLFIIIAFNYNDAQTSVVSYNFYEGFESSGNETSKDKSKKDVKNKKPLKDNKNATTSSSTSSITSTSNESSNTSSKKNNLKGREGFCMSDKELNILRGKQSNVIPVFNNSKNQDSDVLPSDKSIFSGLLSSF